MHNRDCMDYMATLPDGAFDLAVVDPPYGIGEDGTGTLRRTYKKDGSFVKNTDTRNGKPFTVKPQAYKLNGAWDKSRPSKEYFDELLRVSKNQIIWGGNYFADMLPPKSGWIVWDKVNYESNQSDCELAWTSFEKATRMVKYMWNGFLQGDKLFSDKAKGDKRTYNEKRIHPTQKPVILYKWILTNYAKAGDKILDTHGGSGSICIACHDLGFDLTWTELDPDYYAAAVKRYQQHAAQLQIFTQ